MQPLHFYGFTLFSGMKYGCYTTYFLADQHFDAHDILNNILTKLQLESFSAKFSYAEHSHKASFQNIVDLQ